MAMTRASLLFVLVVSACHGAAGGDEGVPQNPDAGSNAEGGKDAAPSPPIPITVTLAEHAPTTVNLVAAYRDGDHAWTAIPTPLLNETYKFTVTSPTWSFAWGCQGSLDYLRTAVNIVTFTVAERTTYAPPESCPRYSGVVKIDGTITHATASSSHDIAFGELSGASVSAISNGTMSFEIWRRPGTHDLYAANSEFVPGHSVSLTSVAVTRGLVVNGTVSNATVDFANAMATSTPVDVSITGDATETLANTILYDASGTALRLSNSWVPPHTSRGLAASQLQPGYVYEQQATGRTCTNMGCDEIDVERWTTSIGAQTVSLPNGLGPVTASRSNGVITATWSPYPDALGYRWTALESATDVDWMGLISAGAAGTAPRIDIGGLSQLPGWSDYAIDPSNQYAGSVTAIVSTRGSADLPPTYPVASGTNRVLASGHLFVAGN